jgi:hypothetical protein
MRAAGDVYDELDPASTVSTAKPTVDGDHGRIETRTATVSTDIGWLQEAHRWPGLAAIGKVVRVRETAARITTETAYYLLSTALPPERFNEIVRSHWGREPAALAAGCGDERRSRQEPDGSQPAQPVRFTPHGAERHAEGYEQGLAARQVQARWLG